MFPFFLTILLLLITTLTPLHSSTTPNPESLALLSFKQSITSDPDNTLSNWNPNTSTSSNPCTWNGITCKDGRVISLSIPKKKLTGYLPSSLGSLSNLRHINLRNNRFHGPLPPSLFHLTGLQSLVLYANSLSGSIPSDISNLIYLQNLDLSQNLLSNSIPSTILNCTRLRTLNLNTNNFTGSLPLGFGSRLTSLERLDLAHNSFTGTIPSDMGNLTNLQGTVDFSRNHFTGAIPPSLGELPEKVYIDLSYNDLTGPIPQHGALINRGPTAFIGNPGLCGPPLKNSCSADDDDDGNGSAASSPSSSSYPSLPSDGRANNDGKGKSGELSKTSIIAIVASDVVGICLIGLLCSYCYTRVCRNGGGSRTHDPGYGLETAGVTPGGKTGGGKLDQCFCFRRDESETPSENVEQYDLVKLDGQVGFDLDELLKASAFVLGKSGIGIVYKVVLEDGLTLAVRRLGEGGSQRFKEFQTEVEAIGKLKHPNIVQLRAYYWSVDEKLLIYEFVPNGNLAAALHGKPGMTTFIPLPWSTRLLIMRGIAKGLVYLHEFSPKKYVHGDLNPSNILLGRNMEPKIADFGLARLANIAGNSPPTLQTSNRMMLAASTSEKPPPPHQRQHSNVPSETATSISTTTNVLAYYQAPESLKSIKPSQKWDVYSYGVILMEIITGRSPLVQVGGGSEMDLVQWIQMCIDEKKPLVDVLDPALAAAEEVGDDDYKEDEIVGALKIAMACVSSSPEKRPSMRHVCDALDQLCE